MTIQQQLDALAARVAALENPLPAPFRAEEFGISATAPGYDQPAAEPAPGSDAKHPPLGYRLEPVGGKREHGYIWWDGIWKQGFGVNVLKTVCDDGFPVANPIPAAEGGSRICAIAQRETERAESATGRAVIAERELAELRATVERLTAENASLEVENRTLRGLVRRMKEVLL